MAAKHSANCAGPDKLKYWEIQMNKHTIQFLAAALLVAFASAASAQQQQMTRPERSAAVTATSGSVVFAPAGDTEWTDLQRNRPVARGDRLWTDDGAHAEVHFGASVLHMAGRTFVEVLSIDGNGIRIAVNEGAVGVRARDMRAGGNVEVSTPQLALRATQPGNWRIDVDPKQGVTRVASRSGAAVLYGAGGASQQIVPGQQMAFRGRDLAPAVVAAQGVDDFDRWAMERNRAEDQSIATRYVQAPPIPAQYAPAPRVSAQGIPVPRDALTYPVLVVPAQRIYPLPVYQQPVRRVIIVPRPQPGWRGGEEGGFS